MLSIFRRIQTAFGKSKYAKRTVFYNDQLLSKKRSLAKELAESVKKHSEGDALKNVIKQLATTEDSKIHNINESHTKTIKEKNLALSITPTIMKPSRLFQKKSVDLTIIYSVHGDILYFKQYGYSPQPLIALNVFSNAQERKSFFGMVQEYFPQ